MAVLLVSILFGQYKFFNKYIKKIGKRIGITPKPLKVGLRKIAIFASGTGSNAQKIIEYLNPCPSPQGEKGVSNTSKIEVALIVSNNPTAGVLQIAAKENIPTLIIEKEKFFRGNAYVDELKEK